MADCIIVQNQPPQPYTIQRVQPYGAKDLSTPYVINFADDARKYDLIELMFGTGSVIVRPGQQFTVFIPKANGLTTYLAAIVLTWADDYKSVELKVTCKLNWTQAKGAYEGTAIVKLYDVTLIETKGEYTHPMGG